VRGRTGAHPRIARVRGLLSRRGAIGGAPSARLSQVLLGVLLVIAAAGFARAEQLKLERSPVAGPKVRQTFSARCNGGARCAGHATLSFALRHPERASVAIVDEDGDVVRRLLPARDLPKGRVRLRWDGRTDAGRLAADGPYRVRVELPSRTITIPDRIVLDNRWPTARITSAHVRTVNGRRQVVVIYRSSEPVRGFILVRAGPSPRDRALALRRARRGHAVWRVHGAAPGPYRVELHAADAAGNLLVRSPSVVVTLP
jgi:FlgD Ig-like domain